MSEPTVTAHSGAFGTPDNSPAFIKKAIEEGCEILEMDVSFRKDGTPVIIHAKKPGEKEGVLLKDALPPIAAAPGIQMNLDLKSVSRLPALEALLREYGLLDRAFFTGVGKRWVKKVRKNSSLPFYLNMSVPKSARKNKKSAKKLADKIKKYGAVGLNCHFSGVNETVVSVLHENNVPVSVWTVNTEEEAKAMLCLGVDNITSRRPDLIRKAAR